MASYKTIFDARRFVATTSTDTSAPWTEDFNITADPADVIFSKSGQTTKARITARSTGGTELIEMINNAMWDGAAYQRDDTSVSTWDVRINPAASVDSFIVQHAAAGANPVTFTKILQCGSAGDVYLNPSGAALSTSAINGFTHLPSCAGIPTGVPGGTLTGAVPFVYDSTDNKAYFYNSSWQPITPDMAQTLTDITGAETIAANNSCVLVGPLILEGGSSITLSSGAALGIL